jgi:serine/threonine protein kinase
MSPEQIEGAPARPSADLWAMAVIAFECLLGFRPFTGTRPAELIRAICSAPVVTPSTLAEVPRGFDDWFARATQRNPADRFPSAKELAEALTDVLVWAATDRSRSPRRARRARPFADPDRGLPVHLRTAPQVGRALPLQHPRLSRRPPGPGACGANREHQPLGRAAVDPPWLRRGRGSPGHHPFR